MSHLNKLTYTNLSLGMVTSIVWARVTGAGNIRGEPPLIFHSY